MQIEEKVMLVGVVQDAGKPRLASALRFLARKSIPQHWGGAHSYLVYEHTKKCNIIMLED